jgi:hypothetical protein
MLRHLRSLRLMQRDQGWINTLLEEAENERMHLLTFMGMRQPGPFFRSAVIVAQGVMFNLLFVAYLLSPKFCHSLVGYLEEEAVKTYTHAIKVRAPTAMFSFAELLPCRPLQGACCMRPVPVSTRPAEGLDVFRSN